MNVFGLDILHVLFIAESGVVVNTGVNYAYAKLKNLGDRVEHYETQFFASVVWLVLLSVVLLAAS